MKNTGIIFASLLGGAAVGAALAMLFTPKSGPEMRSQLKDALGEEIDKMKSTVEKLRAEVKEYHSCHCEEE